MFLYEFLNIFFFLFHSFLIVFNLLGWIWKKNETVEPNHSFIDVFFLVFPRNMVWIRILSLYGLALAGSNKIGILRDASFLYRFFDRIIHRIGSK